MKFEDLHLDPRLLEAISYMNFVTPTPIQEKVIPAVLENRDLIACAQTGTGKTGAYVLPVLHKLVHKKKPAVDTLVIVPTRELAMQIEQQIQGFSYFISATSMAVYGGGDGAGWDQQKAALKNGTDIIIATPGKLLAHLKMGDVIFDDLKHLILDEADKMLDMGFIDDIKSIISYLPKKRQTMMFSATMPGSIRTLARTILHNPVEISFAVSKPAEGVDQKVYLVSENLKIELINHIVAARTDYDSILIFTSTKSKVSEIVTSLKRHGLLSHGISSNLEQTEREEVLRRFRGRQIRILVATDVMSRGIDVKEINLVINYDLPHDAEDYVHRVGRTARVNAKGEAITLVTPKEMYRLKKIEHLIGNVVPRVRLPFDAGIAAGDTEKKHTPGRKGKFHKGNRNFNRNNAKGKM